MEAVTTYQNNTNPVASITQPKKGASMDEIKKAAKDFEAVFVSEMMKPAFETVEVDKNFGGGQSEEMYKSLLVNEYGKKVAERGGIGLAPHIEKEMLKLQEVK